LQIVRLLLPGRLAFHDLRERGNPGFHFGAPRKAAAQTQAVREASFRREQRPRREADPGGARLLENSRNVDRGASRAPRRSRTARKPPIILQAGETIRLERRVKLVVEAIEDAIISIELVYETKERRLNWSSARLHHS